MKNNETEYLNKLFTSSSDDSDESETDFPLSDVPANLSEKLYAISEPALSTSYSIKKRSIWSWPKFASIAASALMAVVLLQVYQQQQTLKQLEQAQSDLATALQYLSDANQITRSQMLAALNENMKKAAITPVVEIGRGSLLPNVDSLELKTEKSHRTL